MLVDSHCHLDCIDLNEHDNSLDVVLEKAKEAGVSQMLCVCLDLEHYPRLIDIANTYPEIYISVGIHPNTELSEEINASTLVRLANNQHCIAIGETGLDYYRSEGCLDWQRNRFIEHINASIETHKPLIIHTRNAKEDTIQLMQSNDADKAGGVMHCFAEDWPTARAALDMGFYISLSGIVTFKNAKSLQELAKKIPLDRLLIETDSPYLAPHPHRGKQNHPALVKHVAEFLSAHLGIEFDTLAQTTRKNFYECFKLHHS